MKKKILFVVTSHDRLGNTNNPTGYYLSEVSHPWSVLISAGYEIDFVSPKGGKAPAEAVDLTDEINKALKSSDNIFFKNITRTLQDNKDLFVDKFLRYVFRTDLKTLKKYNFDEIIDRHGTSCNKWEYNIPEDVIPMWVADMDFAAAPEIREAMQKRLDHPVYGYTHQS